jgi:CBS domain-containing protein
MRVSEICTHPVVSCEPGDSAVEAARKMREANIGNLVVTEHRDAGEVPVGVLTDRDIVNHLVAKDVDPKTLRVVDIMSRELHTVDESEPARETIERMRFKGVRRLPVVNKSGALVGVIALDDLLRTFAEDLSALAGVGARARAAATRRRDR